ncbi:RNA polymerase sigma factor [Mucilaginibacter conchicola]|uniref:RNA polymerase sigma factor n=1 Tax=Mucilaginibacter conchicola TaxID=2303333 RepID=A0A372NZ37_9SPHI|nr:RNA polymerase sigma factor [Mucilaginibacter conchicola]RFZ94929.1 RNA polymerase sigma factor [Mucilaginibacter conchicola]
MAQIITPLETLLAGCRKQDRRAQETLYNQYAKKLFGVCRHYCRDTADAEDVLQEGFVMIFRNIAQYNEQGSFEGWMRRIMVNTSISKYRKAKRQPQYCELDTDYHHPAAPLHDVYGEAYLQHLINRLPGNYRMPFTLFAIEGYSHQEISEQLGISQLLSRTNTSRARAMLRKHLEEQTAMLRMA